MFPRGYRLWRGARAHHRRDDRAGSSLLDRKGILELVEIEKLCAGPHTMTWTDIATSEVLSVKTSEGRPDVARVRRDDN